ncbi:uncharacterized protein LOC112539763 isoform X2 [Tetranychus urticae]|uniref:F-box domain-containing protein n=1 Tax=Tetranychus urticae TaxID=32264 RepID=T1L5N1_TETUR|nr:uncharacterized protein LOC112539763 isoform X2 [Tetranychus urticae]
MLINELPDDCLLAIFDYIQDLEDLINCFKVCDKWCNLIVGRTKKIKYLIDQPSYSHDYFCFHLKELINVTCLSRLFPNLRIAESYHPPYGDQTPIEDFAKLIRDSESLKGIIHGSCYVLDFELMSEYANLEMLSTGSIRPNLSKINENVKQLHLTTTTLDILQQIAHYFPNLEKLHTFTIIHGARDSDEQVLPNLKILELEDCAGCCHSFLFMDSCPALQSAHITIGRTHITINDSIKNLNLRDLVIHSYEPIEWNVISRCISKCPNLKHLAIRGTYLKDEHIQQLILILPKLTLLDVRKSRGVTQEAADHVRDYCKQYGRSIKFYFKKDDKQIESDWPQLLNRPDKVCLGFDFMEHCFFKNFNDLPHFLDPVDDLKCKR